MMNGPIEHHDDLPAANTEAPESGELLAGSSVEPQSAVQLGGCSSTPESGLPLAESSSSSDPVEPPVELPPAPQMDTVSDDVREMCNALLDTIEVRMHAEMSPPLSDVQIAETPFETEVSSLPECKDSRIPPDFPVPDCVSHGDAEATNCTVNPESIFLEIDRINCLTGEPEVAPSVHLNPAPMKEETPSSPELPVSQDLPPVLEVLPSLDSAAALNCSRFGRVRKRPRLSPPDTPVKKQKVVLKVTESEQLPAPVKKQKVVLKVTELGPIPDPTKKLNVKSKVEKPEPALAKKLKSKSKESKQEQSPAPVKKLKTNSKVSKQRPVPGLPSSVKTTKVKSKATKLDTVPKKSKLNKSASSIKVATLECRHIKNKWNPGDVVWFKVCKEPYWPGKVTHDTTGEFKRIRGGMNEYCLLPFGQDSSFKWVLAPMMLKFHGRQQFEEHKQTLLNKHPEDSPTRTVIETKFSVTNFKLEEWIKVVQEAENGFLNGRLEAIKVEVGEKKSGETKVALPKQEEAKSAVKKTLLGNSLLVPQKRTQKRKDPSPQKKQKKASSADRAAEADAVPEKKKASKSKSTTTQQDAAPKKAKKKQKPNSSQSPAVEDKNAETSELNTTASSIESTIQEVLNFSGESSPVQEMEPADGEENVDARPKKKKITVKKKMPVKDESKKRPAPDDSRGRKIPDLGASPCQPSKKRVRTSPLKRFLTDAGQHSGDSDSGSSAKKDSVPPEGKYEKVCQACEQIIPSSDGVRCIGNCNSIFHVACTKPTDPPVKDGSYKCEECTTGLHSCFACKENAGGEIKRCSIRLCGKFYHPSCLDLYRTTRMDGDHITCSLHSCMSCALNLNATSGKKGRMVRCLRCPIAYHFTEDCLAAGSLVVSHSSIICPKHYEPKKIAKMMHVNVNWCFVCSSGGSLICCESCPASFHAECLGIVPPEGSYYCAECLAGTQPKYGIIVWVKLGNYRWWPAKVINPRNAPSNIRNMPHQVGEFPVCFFGTHDYYWTTRSRVFQFLEGDQGAHDNTANRLAKRYEKALNEACVAYHEWKIAKECRAAQDYEKNSLIPPRYKPIKVNRPVGRVSMTTADPSQMTPCDCDPNSENPCGSDSECLNRMLMFECHPSVCAAGEKCQNQRFEKRKYMPAEIFRAEGKGWGLKSLVDIKKGEFVNEYIGEIIDEMECRLRMKKMHEENNTNYYFLTIDKDRIIDAARKGNLSRFMNHSCQPNCETHKWTVNGNTRVGLFAVCDIPNGTELTFNYNLDCLGNNKTTCRCEAPNCSGFIGERPKRATQKSCQKENDKAAGMKKKKRKKAAVKCEHEDECFRCGHDGELLMCDRKNCPKAYHLSCLSLEKPPHGRWECPWHHCDMCGRVSTSLCLICPNSYCKEHAGDNIKTHDDGITYCTDHIKEDEAIHLSVDVGLQNPAEAEGACIDAPKVEPTIINLKKRKCERMKEPPAEKKEPVLVPEKEPVLVPDKKRQRMIAEKLKIKLNGSRKHGYPTCKRISDMPKKGKVTVGKKQQRAKVNAVAAHVSKTAKVQHVNNGVLKPNESAPTVKIKSVNGSVGPINGTKKHCKLKTALCSKSVKNKKAQPVSKAVLVRKLNGKTIKLAPKKKSTKAVVQPKITDMSEGTVERTEKSAPQPSSAGEAAAAAAALPKVTEPPSQPT